MVRTLRRVLILFVVVGSIGIVVWVAHRRQHQPPTPVVASHQEIDSHMRMVNALEGIRRRSLVADPYFQTQSILTQGRELAELPVLGSKQRRFQLHVFQGQDYRRIGQIDLAIKHVLEAERFLKETSLNLSPKMEEKVLYEIAVTFLRKGETDNCLHCLSSESCILPIQGGGIHQQQTGSRTAMEYFQRILQENPDHLQAKWLLNVAAMTLGEFPSSVPESMRISPNSLSSDIPFPRFTDIARNVGLRTISCAGAAIADDFDNDGLIDILTTTWDPGGQVHLLHNTGDGDFSDETEQAGLTGILGGLNGVQADFDNDGNLDVYLVRGAWLGLNGRHPNSLLRNVDGGSFRDVTFELGLGEVHYPTSTAAWSDFDLDGDVDLFVGNEDSPCQLFRNDGAAGFTDIASIAGVTNDRFTKGSSWGDFDGDRRPDLYLSNLGEMNRLYHNNGDGTFTDLAPELNIQLPLKSFPTWFWDVNNDGHLDLYVASYDMGLEHVAAEYCGLPRTDESDRLYLNDGHGGFRDVSSEYGLTQTTQPMGCNFGDLDNDGFLDFYLGTGYPELDAIMPNRMFHNVRGEKFEEVSLPGGFAHLQKGHGTAFADLDNDGDQDVFMQMGGAYPVDAFGNVLYENPGFDNHWMRLKLVGDVSNRFAIGVRIRVNIVDGEKRRSIYRHVNSGGSFGGNPLQPQIGLGQAARVESLEVYWPVSDTRQIFNDLPVDRLIEIHEGQDDYRISKIDHINFKPGNE
jgi:hypothetical protein